MQDPLLTIIVPVYKCEAYINRCIDSIINQTYKNLEIILIDDGSPDKCPEICDEYALNDKRVKVIHQKNSGVSAARNAGIEVASGSWIGFVDSDDWTEPNMFESLLNDAEENNAEISICGIIDRSVKKDKSMVLDSSAAKSYLFRDDGFGGFSFLKLIRKDVIKSVRFDTNMKYMEDTLFFYNIFGNCSRISWNNIPLYHYEMNAASVTHQYGLSLAAKTGLDMLLRLENEEQNKKIKKSITESLFLFSKNLIADYLKNKDFENEAYAYLYNIGRSRLLKVLFIKHINYKSRMYGFLAFNKKLSKYLYRG